MRVVSLLPAATDIICALGAGTMLVGVTHECDAVGQEGVPRVTTSAVDADAAAAAIDGQVRKLSSSGTPLFLLDEAGIRAARPDLFITQALCDVCAVSEDDVRALAARLSPSPHILTLGATTLEGVMAEVALVATAVDRADDGTALLVALRARIGAVHRTLKMAAAPRPRVAVIEWTEPLFAAGHWVPDMVKRAGGTDVLALPGAHSTTCTIGDLRDANPDILLIAPCGYGLERATQEGRALLAGPEWAWTRERSVWAVDSNTLVSRPGPRLVDGIEMIARILHPSLFSPLEAGAAACLV